MAGIWFDKGGEMVKKLKAKGKPWTNFSILLAALPLAICQSQYIRRYKYCRPRSVFLNESCVTDLAVKIVSRIQSLRESCNKSIIFSFKTYAFKIKELYVSKEVLQFCDFFCAILSFWVTIISMAKLPEKMVSFLHMFGVLLVAILVQYNRNGIQVFVVPIPLGLLIFIVTLAVRSIKKRRPLKANRNCAIWLSLGVLFAVGAVLIFALIETTSNYQYVHSGWHILIALSLGKSVLFVRTKIFTEILFQSFFYRTVRGRNKMFSQKVNL